MHTGILLNRIPSGPAHRVAQTKPAWLEGRGFDIYTSEPILLKLNFIYVDK
jgi:hypothetical protein